jgi:nucleotide-binding universal stress UspA family protein
MYESILWATDASPASDLALAEALKLLQPGGRLIAFHCDERFAGSRVGGLPLNADEFDHVLKIESQVQELLAGGIDAEFEIEVTHKPVAGAIAAAAEHHAADAIVCGTRGLGGVAGTIAGSVAMRLPHIAMCPVIVVPEKARKYAPLALA